MHILMLSKPVFPLSNASFVTIHLVVSNLTEFASFCYNRWTEAGFMGDNSHLRSWKDLNNSWGGLDKDTQSKPRSFARVVDALT
jgi:hypothetical protein